MGLSAALRAHKGHDYDLAAKEYQRALNQGEYSEILFQNYGSILRSHGKNDIAQKVYEQGLSLFPKHEGIRSNFANLLQITSPWRSFDLHLSILYNHWEKNDLSSSHFFPLVQILESEGCFLWAYQICKVAVSCVKLSPPLLVLFYKIITNKNLALFSRSELSSLSSLIDNKLDELSILDQAEFFFTLSWVHVTREEFDAARNNLEKARQSLLKEDLLTIEERERAQVLNNQNSWNMACTLLAHQQFDDGWTYFDYGLRTKAAGSQKWQRALPKPFTYDQISLWRGDDLTDKSLLLLEEQGIGDVMQFMSLLPTLLEEAQHIGILICNRLLPIYKRSFNTYISTNRLSLYSFDDVSKGLLNPKLFHFQSPLGSICRYHFTDIALYGTNSPNLLPDRSEADRMRQKYINGDQHIQYIVGISWRGGGNSDRMTQKSVPLPQFSKLFKMPGVRFVSLQYGDAKNTVNTWRREGYDVIHDPSVNSLKNMDTWLSQVSACDAVISVANTTIHGAGGLNIPTMCLLSLHSDWRWLINKNVKRSYWYPSVGILREDKSDGWNSAFADVFNWMQAGFHYPVGAVSS